MAKISLYKGTQNGSEVYIVKSPVVSHPSYVPKEGKIPFEDRLNDAVRLHISMIKESGADYNGLIKQKPELDNGYHYSDIEEPIFNKIQDANPGKHPFSGYGCIVTPIRTPDVIEEYWKAQASLKK